MVLENPRKVPHEEMYRREISRRQDTLAAMQKILTKKGVREGMEALQFSSRKLYKQFRAAYYLADIVHKGQIDKGGTDYICHPVMVAVYLQEKLAPSSQRDRAMIVALLHDTLEDTAVTAEALKSFGFGRRIIHTVKLLSRENGERYLDYLERVMQSKLARIVKIADLTDNMNLYRIRNPSQRDVNRSEFYRSCRCKLEERMQA